MDKKIEIVYIYWIESHKESEELKVFISINNEKIECIPIYKTNKIMNGYISSVYTYNIPKIDSELNLIPGYVIYNFFILASQVSNIFCV